MRTRSTLLDRITISIYKETFNDLLLLEIFKKTCNPRLRGQIMKEIVLQYYMEKQPNLVKEIEAKLNNVEPINESNISEENSTPIKRRKKEIKGVETW